MYGLQWMKMSVCDKVLHWKSMFIDMFKKMIIVVDIRGFLWWSRCSYSDVSHKRFRLCGKGSTIYCWERDLRQSYLVFRGSPLNFKSNSYHKRNEMWYIPTKMDKIFLKFIKLIYRNIYGPYFITFASIIAQNKHH